jgi:hypothetical protein
MNGGNVGNVRCEIMGTLGMRERQYLTYRINELENTGTSKYIKELYKNTGGL